ncbi:sensor histidine kinase [Desulfosporosinus sp. PR]|uniref:sensor histidine kinase n=1 Tax=Candidatus Desulfosporosinus nitrosoreducens TaxID=3401928 RepID=UPI0028002708|nr:sensor histidine kinase [Desulfosporosinus sp. PR]MDQ7092428.1 sensor histidine kinase [Desulfosporosinus sp. PR]
MSGEIIKRLCSGYTNLTEADVQILETLASQIPYMAELTGTDVFIDAMLKDGADGVVLAWARPKGRSLYERSVVGELAFATSEPAVYRTFRTGITSRNVRGVSQEGVPIAQTVVAIRNLTDDIIGTLIMERDISEELRQEEQVEFLTQTAERLSNTLMQLSATGSQFEDWVENGIFILNKYCKITYANKRAAQVYKDYQGFEAFGHDFPLTMLQCSSCGELLSSLKKPVEFRILNKSFYFQAYPLVTFGELSGCVISFRDITDLRKKEQELHAQSTIIREIHHRVKNNLQTVAALLRLQMRRSDLEIVKAEFSASINRISSIAAVHDVFAYQDTDSIDLKELCQRILKGLLDAATLPEQNVATRIEGPAILLPSSQAVPLALVINELLTNSLKHGVQFSPQGLLALTISQADDWVYLSVQDNGPEPRVSLKQSRRRLGLQIVESLVQGQLGGKYSMERVEGMTRVTVCFPSVYLGRSS